ncbi:hypothetical protein ODJ79_14335 [Actinoplanes sp. KI2]|uniref:hypothetical protein n=1 Tax=Actinoplanes sp. KI2 TaxID=2983315 RepID=UPI0021D5D363|nr:hypothetical protein [Actinoplanes sp. KI2]MCU7724901.1 hypothetical protein [Actinoplanes sp. KI2]
MADVERLGDRIAAAVEREGADVSWEHPTGSQRILWVTGDDLPTIGVIVASGPADVQILCDDFTFESVEADAAAGVVLELVTGEPRIVERGWIGKALVLQVTAGRRTYEAARSGRDAPSGWEARLIARG